MMWAYCTYFQTRPCGCIITKNCNYFDCSSVTAILPLSQSQRQAPLHGCWFLRWCNHHICRWCWHLLSFLAIVANCIVVLILALQSRADLLFSFWVVQGFRKLWLLRECFRFRAQWRLCLRNNVPLFSAITAFLQILVKLSLSLSTWPYPVEHDVESSLTFVRAPLTQNGSNLLSCALV